MNSWPGKSGSTMPQRVTEQSRLIAPPEPAVFAYQSLADLDSGIRQHFNQGKWGTRHTFVLMAFLGFTLVTAARLCINIAIVSMVRPEDSGMWTVHGTQCTLPNTTDDMLNETQWLSSQTYSSVNWSASEQGTILGSIQLGIIFTQIPGGMLAEIYGGTWIVGASALGSGLLVLLHPVASSVGSWCLIVCRIVMGLFIGLFIPALFSMIALWIPPKDRSRVVTIIWSGLPIGNCLALPLGALLASSFGWESVFYFFGAICSLFGVAWVAMCHDSPARHPRIQTDELDYISSSMPQSSGVRTKAPLGKILRSWPVWALIITFMGQSWAFNTLLIEMPNYLHNIQHVPLTENGLVSALPFLMLWLFSLPVSWLSDWILSRKLLSLSVTRKLMTNVASIGPAVFMLILAYIGCNSDLAIFLLCSASMLNGAKTSGFHVNNLELSAEFAGTLKGLTNTLANFVGFFPPYFVGKMTENNQTLEAWRVIFGVSSGSLMLSSVIFTLWGETRPQNF